MLSALLGLATARPALAVTGSVSATQSFQTLVPGKTNALCFTVTISSSNLLPVTLQSLRFTNRSAGPGTQAQLDAELGAAVLYRDAGAAGFQGPGTDTSLLTSSASGGALLYSPLNVSIPAFGSVTLFVATQIPKSVRDGDNLALSIQASAAIGLSQGLIFTNSFPVDPAGSIAIDGSSAAQDSIVAVGPGNILAGSSDNLALDVRIPSNGYQGDILQKIAVQNEGTATLAEDIAAVRAWTDNGDGTFHPASDHLLGTMTFTGDRWQLTGLADSIRVPGLRTFVSVDLRDFATNGRTVRLAIPWLPDPGIGVFSTNDGPIDQAARNPNFLTVSTADRITLVSVSAPSSAARPGQTGILLADLTMTNAYTVTKTLSEMAFTNKTTGPGSRSDLDDELDQLTLRYDGNQDGVLGTLVQDPVLGTARFQNAEVRFTGFSQALGAGQTRHVFVTADLSVDQARDGDAIGVAIDGASQVRFDDSTRIFAAWPLDSGARATVDGMVAAQIAVNATPAITLGKNEGPALALDLVLPRNGYQDDALNGLRVVNLGTATNSDVQELRLWRDGGNGQLGGDDQDLGPMVWQVDHWQSGALSSPLGVGGGRYFVSVTVSGSPADSTTIRLAIPVNGITNASGNDGPLDAPIAAPNALLLSNAPLLVSIDVAPGTSTVGQSVSARVVVRNVGSESVLGITPSALTSGGAGSLTPVSGPQPASFNLMPGARDSFLYVYTAAQAGDVTLTGAAGGTGSPSGSPRNALPSSSNTHHVFTHTPSIAFTGTSTLPASVARGQQGVAAVSIGLTHPGNASFSGVRVTGVRVRIEDATGAGIVPSSLLGRVVVREGGNVLLDKTSLETAGSDVDLALTTPVILAAGGSTALALSVDVLSSTTVTDFRLVVVDGAAFSAEDQNNAAAVSVTSGAGFPYRTAIANVVAKATELDVAGDAPVLNRVGQGLADVPLLGLNFQSPGIAGITSDVRIYAFAAVLEDTAGVTIPRPSDVLSFVRVVSGAQTLVGRPVAANEGPALLLTFSLPVNASPNTPLHLALRGDVSSSSRLGGVRLRLLDSTTVDARDAITHDPVPAAYATNPILGNTVVVEDAADSIRVAGTAAFPSRATVGAANVTALRMSFRHPGPAAAARIVFHALTVQCRDESRHPLIPSDYLSKVVVTRGGTAIATVTGLPSSGGSVTIPIPDPMLEPAESLNVDLRVDFSATAPAGSIELMVFGDGIAASDVDRGTPVTPLAESGFELPMASGLCRLEPPPRQL